VTSSHSWGLIFGIIGLVQSGKRGAGKGLSIAAIILAVAAFVISIVVNMTTVAAVDTAVKNINTGQGTPATVTGKIGQPVKDGSFTFVVHSVKCGMTTSGGSLPSKPQGEFCAVNLTVTNHGTKAQLFDALEVKGFIAGSKYEADSVASAMANPHTDTFLNSINPGNSINAIVLIDVPAGKQLDTVELHDSLFSTGTSVSVK
jgi:preprotein translocase subunit SecG